METAAWWQILLVAVAAVLVSGSASERGEHHQRHGKTSHQRLKSQEHWQPKQLLKFLRKHYEAVDDAHAYRVNAGVEVLELDSACVTRASPYETIIASPAFQERVDLAVNELESIKGKTLKSMHLRKVIRSEPLLPNLTYTTAHWSKNAAFVYGAQKNVYWNVYFEPKNFYHSIEILDGGVATSPALAVAAAHARLRANRPYSAIELLTPEEKLSRHAHSLLGSLFNSSMFGFVGIHYLGESDASSWRCYPKLFVMLSRELISHLPSPITRAVLTPRPSVRTYWRQRLGQTDDLAATSNWPKDGKTTVVVVNRPKSRRIVNVEAVAKALRGRGWTVKVISFEGKAVDDQFLAGQDATTFIGAHGAGLRWGQYLHPRAAMMQLVGFPCAIEVQSQMGLRPRYAIIRSIVPNVTTEADFARVNHWCDLVRKHGVGMSSSPMSPEDELAIREWDRDVRKHNVDVDIPMLIRAVEMIDPVQAPLTFPVSEAGADHQYRYFKPIPIPAF